MRKTLLVLCSIISVIVLHAQNTMETSCYVKDAKGSIRNHNMDFIKLSLDLKFDAVAGRVNGIANYDFMPLQKNADTLFLDGLGMEISSLKVDGKNTKYRIDSAGITIYFDPSLTWETKHNLQIAYSCTPRKGIYFVGWKKESIAKKDDPDRIRKQIWTQGQGIDNRNWIPGYDDVNDKLLTDLTITFDKNYRVISNGNLLTETPNADGTKTWHYAMTHPHALYLIMLAIGEYDYKDYTSKNGITSRQYYYPDRAAAVSTTYRLSAEMMDWLQNETGVTYPWQTYSNVPVQEFLYGAMENTTATVYTDYFLQDPRSAFDRDYDAINTHELTHQWFGDYITEYSSTSHWLHESFATYYAKIFMRTVEGEEAYAWNRRNEMNTGISADNKDEYPLAHSSAGSSRHYQKGSYVLDMLRYVAGDAQYKKTITDYLNAHPYQNVTTYDLQMQFMRTLGLNLDWFFDEWVYKSGYPVYDVQYTVTAQATSVNVKQTQKITSTVGLFKMPVHLEINYTDGSAQDTLVWISNAESAFSISNKKAKQIAFVLFDPGNMLYDKVNFKKEYPELLLQAQKATHYIDRYDAIVAMRTIPLTTKRNDLLKIYSAEKHFGIKAEIITQIMKESNDENMPFIKNALHDSDANVRLAVVNNTTVIPKKLEKDYAALLNDSSYINIEADLRLMMQLNPDKKAKYLRATEGLYGMNKNIRIAWLEGDYALHGNANVKELVAYAGYSYEFRTRNRAFEALRTINYCDADVVNNLFDAAVSSNSRLAGPARNTLQFFMQKPEYNTLINKIYTETKWEDWQKKRLEQIFVPK